MNNLTISFPILNIYSFIMIEKLYCTVYTFFFPFINIMSHQKIFAVIYKTVNRVLFTILSANFISILKITLKRSVSYCLSVERRTMFYIFFLGIFTKENVCCTVLAFVFIFISQIRTVKKIIFNFLFASYNIFLFIIFFFYNFSFFYSRFYV